MSCLCTCLDGDNILILGYLVQAIYYGVCMIDCVVRVFLVERKKVPHVYARFLTFLTGTSTLKAAAAMTTTWRSESKACRNCHYRRQLVYRPSLNHEWGHGVILDADVERTSRGYIGAADRVPPSLHKAHMPQLSLYGAVKPKSQWTGPLCFNWDSRLLLGDHTPPTIRTSTTTSGPKTE